MNSRIENILRLTTAFNMPAFRRFEPSEENNTYRINSDLSEFGHKTWLWYELSDEFLRIEITCIFGEFELADGFDPNYFVFLLIANNPSFRNSCAYVGAKEIGDTLHISLQTSQVFLPKWDDADIAKALAVKFFDLASGLMFRLPDPKPMKIYGE